MLKTLTGTVYVNAATVDAAAQYAHELTRELTRREPRVLTALVDATGRRDRVGAHAVDVRLLVEPNAGDSDRDTRDAIVDASADVVVTLTSDSGTFGLALWDGLK